jgi:hypothetical protein
LQMCRGGLSSGTFSNGITIGVELMSSTLLPAAFAAAALAFLSFAANAQYAEGACGGVMRGFDGRGYQCASDRKPVCEQGSGRCVCLQRRDCGARRDEGWYDN